ncbi:MAG: S8 family serine peptidase [Bryobacteraceae bacterium]
MAPHAPSQSQFIPNRYTLVLSDAPVSDRFTTREALATAEADTYRRQVESAQAQVKSALATRNIEVLGSVSVLQNLIFVAAPASRLAELQSLPGVVAVKPARKMKVLLNRATMLSNAPQAWAAVGGQSSAGAGIKIGVIDTGIDQTHPALQDSSLSMPSGFPKGATAYTTNKVIVARSYVSLLSDTNPIDSLPDDTSPRDRIGHGTFNAVVAAGNSTSTPAIADATTGSGAITISGMAPKAWLGNYKVGGSPGVEEFASDQTLIQAVEDAVSDGMDIITCSIGGTALSNVASDPVATAYEAATKFAVVVAAAGDGGSDSYNEGYQYPGFNTISSPSNAPDVISVGATLNSHIMQPTVSVNVASAPSSLKGMAAAVGDAYCYPSCFGASDAPLVDVTTIGDPDGLACNALPAGSLTGSYALILRGTCTFDTKALNAQNAGAIGFIYYMATSGASVSPEGINEYGPSVMISNTAGLALKGYIDANPGAMVTVDLNGMEQDVTAFNLQPCVDSAGPCPALGSSLAYTTPVAANQLASYSSMGPTPDGQLKPDLVAIGGFDPEVGQYLDPNDPYLPAPSGMYSGTQYYDPNEPFDVNVFSSNRYAAGAGTSFSTPLVAGAAALLKQKHPSLQPTQIKSLMVNYAAQDTTTDDFEDPVDVEWIGAGGLDANAAMNGAVTAVPSTISFGILNSATLPISKTITLTNIGSASVSLSASVSCCYVNGSAGAGALSTVAVSPTSVSLAAGATTALIVTLSGSKPAASEYSGNVVLSNSSTTLRIPFMALESDGAVFNVLPSIGGEGVPGEDNGPAYVQLTDAYGVPVAGSPVTFSVSPVGSLTLQSVSGEPACSPASSTSTVICPSDQFGNAWVDVVNGPTVSTICATTGNDCPTVNFSAAGGNTGGGTYNVQAAPNVTSVSDSAAGKSPVAPGSYVSLYGTGLSDYTDVDDATTDALAANGTYTVLPLQIDFVEVTFDVPSAGISLPAGVVYVSPTQINIQVPWELQGQSSAQMKVVIDGDLFGNVVTVPIGNYNPQFFTYGSDIAVAQDSGFNLITTSNPAKRGSPFIILYMNGLGPVSNQPASGNPALGTSATPTTPVVSFGGVNGTVLFSGLTPGFPGLYQINVAIPTSVTPGSAVPVTVSIGGVTSAPSTLPIQ